MFFAICDLEVVDYPHVDKLAIETSGRPLSVAVTNTGCCIGVLHLELGTGTNGMINWAARINRNTNTQFILPFYASLKSSLRYSLYRIAAAPESG